MKYSIDEIVTFLGDMVINQQALKQHSSMQFIGIAPLDTASSEHLAFLANSRYQDKLTNTQAGAVLVTETQANLCSHTLPIIVKNPYLAYAQLTQLFVYQANISLPIIHPTAIIASTATLANNVQVGAYCVIGENVSIGENGQLSSHVIIEDNVSIGQNCQIKSHTFIGHHCQLGNNVELHSHVSIGNEGFGYAPKGDTATQGWQKIHQLGRVIIGNHVRIGSQTCVDRGALGDTIIDDHVIIDNLVQIAHNVQIGAGTAISGCVGIAGSSRIGKRCILAGGVGLVGHLQICDDVTITGMTMVTKSIEQAGSYSSGTPMMPTSLWKRALVGFKKLAKSNH